MQETRHNYIIEIEIFNRLATLKKLTGELNAYTEKKKKKKKETDSYTLILCHTHTLTRKHTHSHIHTKKKKQKRRSYGLFYRWGIRSTRLSLSFRGSNNISGVQLSFPAQAELRGKNASTNRKRNTHELIHRATIRKC